jgi:hypothetical protein
MVKLLLSILIFFVSLQANAFQAEPEELQACRQELLKIYDNQKADTLLENASDVKVLSEIAYVITVEEHRCFFFYNASGDLEGASID